MEADRPRHLEKHLVDMWAEALMYIPSKILVEADADKNEDILVALRSGHWLTGWITTYKGRKLRHLATK